MSERPPQRHTGGAPAWLKALGIIALLAIALLVVLLLTSGHGPGRHIGLGASCPQPSTPVDAL